MYSREIITFITVAECGSFLKASEKLYLTAASVMNQINKLEADVGVKLFERTAAGTRLTRAGLSYYDDAKRIIEECEQAKERALQIAEEQNQTVRVGTSIMRPCRMLIELWSDINDGAPPFNLKIMPFGDNPSSMEAMMNSLGKDIDCFVGPCDSYNWKRRCSIFILGYELCRIALSRKHKLAKKESLKWTDLDGQTLMLVKRGSSSVLDNLRDEIETNHSEIKIKDIPHFYDTDIFNECESGGNVMETLDIWKDVHPSIVTLPMDWNYKIPYGIVYSKRPSDAMRAFIKTLNENVRNTREVKSCEEL